MIPIKKENEPSAVTDGGTSQLHTGRKTSRIYYWVDPDTDSALVHTGVNEEYAIPYFDSVGEAEKYLDRIADGNKEAYDGLSLYEARVKKVGDAVDVLMQQAGVDDFFTNDD